MHSLSVISFSFSCASHKCAFPPLFKPASSYLPCSPTSFYSSSGFMAFANVTRLKRDRGGPPPPSTLSRPRSNPARSRNRNSWVTSPDTSRKRPCVPSSNSTNDEKESPPQAKHARNSTVNRSNHQRPVPTQRIVLWTITIRRNSSASYTNMPSEYLSP